MAEKQSTQDSVPLCESILCDKPAIGRCTYGKTRYYCNDHINYEKLSLLNHLEQRFTSKVKAIYGWVAFMNTLLALACWSWYLGLDDFFQTRDLIGNETNLIIALILSVVSCCSLIVWNVERYRAYFRYPSFWNVAEKYFTYDEDMIEREFLRYQEESIERAEKWRAKRSTNSVLDSGLSGEQSP